jgi:murein DD-endopeptidase MepM/ murein hydrolase activator NlpD
MEQLKQLRSELKKLRRVQQSVNIYQLPLEIRYLEWTSALPGRGTHNGVYKGALDLIYGQNSDFDESRDKVTALAPLDGQVLQVRDDSDMSGPHPEFASEANYIKILHAHGEKSKIIHLAKGSSQVKEGDRVVVGQPIAHFGWSGYVGGLHCHWEVKIDEPSQPHRFRTLRPRLAVESWTMQRAYYRQQNPAVSQTFIDKILERLANNS